MRQREAAVRCGSSSPVVACRCDARTSRRGQAYVETALAVAMISLLFFGLFQLSQIFAAREILYHAAHRAARARTVGFNRWMVEKTTRVAAIPNAGRMLEPVLNVSHQALVAAIQNEPPGEIWDMALGASPRSLRADIENARIPEYLGSANPARAAYILDYEDWDTVGRNESGAGGVSSSIEMSVFQRYPLLIAMHRLFYAPQPDTDGTDRVGLEGRVEIENHYPLYLNDQSW